MKLKKTAKTAIITIAILLIAGVICAAGILYGYRFAPCITEDAIIHIPSSSPSYATLCDTLKARDLVMNSQRLNRYARLRGFDNNVRAGRYKLRQGMSANALFNMISSGSQSAVRLTFNNIRTLPQLAGRVGAQLECDSSQLVTYLLDSKVAETYGFTAENFIGMFIPNTYELWWTATPEEFTGRMKREYDNFWNDVRTALLARTGLTREQVTTLASIVSQETNKSDEMPTIAGVYINRLKIGMPLQADPTVKFAVGDFGLKRILIRHTQYESPYNTYLHQGLPPGPICMPSITAIDAVLNYKEHNYLYFCAKEDFSGYHNFARTLAEHNRNARAYSAALDRAKIR